MINGLHIAPVAVHTGACQRERFCSCAAMPGHIKLTKGAVDPDPTEFLIPSIEMKRADQAKPYDSKKSVWIPCPKVRGGGPNYGYVLLTRGLNMGHGLLTRGLNMGMAF